jgi:hypothetical protein
LSTPPASSTTDPANDSRLFTAAPTFVAFESSYQRTPPRSATSARRCGSGSIVSIACWTPDAVAPASRATVTAASRFSVLCRPTSRVGPSG